MPSTTTDRAACAMRGLVAILVVTTLGCAETPADLPPGDVVDGGAVVADAPPGDTTTVTADAPRDAIVVTVDVRRSDAAVMVDVPLADTAVADVPPCGVGATCPAGFACYTVGCLPVSSVGEPCGPSSGGPGRGCVRDLSCAPLGRAYRCVVTGSDRAPCIGLGFTPANNPRRRCLAGLACYEDTFSDGQCRPGLAVGEFCEGTALRCVEGLACETTNGVPRCVARSTAEVRVVPVGSDCDGGSVQCTAGASCVPGVGGSRCVAYGGPGARCLDASPNWGYCDPGVECQTPNGYALCRRRVARGMPCDPTGTTTVCAEGDGCTTDLAGVSTCAAPGSAPGSDCRTTGTPCDGDLRCSNFSRYRSTCRVVAALSGACDLRQESSLCPEGTRCVPSASAGVVSNTCRALVAETEPNDAPTALRSAVTGSTTWRGALQAGDPQDCFAVRSEGEVSLRLEVCITSLSSAGLVVSLYGPAGAELSRWNVRDQGGHGPLAGCGLFTPATHGVLRRLPAGTMTVCVRAAGSGAYQLAIGVLAP